VRDFLSGAFTRACTRGNVLHLGASHPSLRAISEKLAERGHVNVNGVRYAAKSIASMVAR
jgi:hypothetical protein